MDYLTIDNRQRLAYKIIGEIGGCEDKPCLIFLHEGLGCTAMWKDFPEMLCRKCGCPGLVYDRLGYGKSSPSNLKRTSDYLHTSALEELPQVIAELIPEKPYILIGHSDGGSISLLLGAENPKLLKAMITEAAHVFVDQKCLAGIKKAERAWAGGKLDGLWKYHGEKTETIFRDWADTWQAEWFKSWEITEVLVKIVVPLLVIQGKNDQYGGIKQATTIAEKSSGYSSLELIDNCGHVPHLESQGYVLELMTDFIQKNQS